MFYVLVLLVTLCTLTCYTVYECSVFFCARKKRNRGVRLRGQFYFATRITGKLPPSSLSSTQSCPCLHGRLTPAAATTEETPLQRFTMLLRTLQ
eukprot:3084017-Amphidinium_carterae.2